MKATPDASDTEAQAAQWLVRLEADCSPCTVEPWLKWLDGDVRRRAVFVRLERSWCRTNTLRRMQPLDGRINLDILDTFPGLPPQSPVTNLSRQSWWRRLWGAGDSFTVALAARALARSARAGSNGRAGTGRR